MDRAAKLLNLLKHPQSSPGLRRAAAKQLAITCDHLATEEDDEGRGKWAMLLKNLLDILLFTIDDNDLKQSAAYFLELLSWNTITDHLYVGNVNDEFKDPNMLWNSIESLNLQTIHDSQETLLASSRQGPDNSNNNIHQHCDVINKEDIEKKRTQDLARQRRQVSQALGALEGIDTSLDKLVEDSDLITADDSVSSSSTSISTPLMVSSPSEESSTISSNSARQRAVNKRKAKQLQEFASKRLNLDTSLELNRNFFIQICNLLRDALLSPLWNVRMGALYGVEAILLNISHDKTSSLTDKKELGPSHLSSSFLPTLIILLVRDGFVDFQTGDQAAAPIRELAARLLFDLLLSSCTLERSVQVLEKYQFLLDSSKYGWNEHLSCFLILSQASDHNVTIPLSMTECIVKVIIGTDENLIGEEEEEEEEISQALHLLSKLPQLNVHGTTDFISRLCKLLLTASDISIMPVYIFDILTKLENYLDPMFTLPFILHSLSSVRRSALQYLQHIYSSSHDNISWNDLVLQQLFQSCLLENDESDDCIAERSQNLILQSTCRSEIWKRWLKILMTPIDKPLPVDLFIDFSFNKSDGTVRPITGRAPSWTLGLKAADLMLLSTQDVWRRRLCASVALKDQIAKNCVPDDLAKIKAALIKSKHGYHRLLSFFLFSPTKSNENSIVEENGIIVEDLLEFQQDSRLLDKTSTEYQTQAIIWSNRLMVIRPSSIMQSNQALNSFILNEPISCLRDAICQQYARHLSLDQLIDLMDAFPQSSPSIIKFVRDPATIEGLKTACQNNLIRLNVILSSHNNLWNLDQMDAMHILSYRPINLHVMECLKLALSQFPNLDWSLIVSSEFLHLLSSQQPTLLVRFVAFLTEKELLTNWLPAFIPSLLQVMTASKSDTSQEASHVLSQVLRVLPTINHGDQDGSVVVYESVSRGWKFLENLSNPTTFQVSLPEGLNPTVTLRHYQLEGYQWLVFLAESGLHGALCDDMGLGKTLQTLCAISHSVQKASLSEDTKKTRCCLIICPSSLTGHWQREAATYYPNLKVILYGASKQNAEDRRSGLASMAKHHDVLITSYEVVRNDIDHFRNVPFLYVVLDEGHLIRNPKSKLSVAVRQLQGRNRLILTGTPIQNNVLELWTLFDFLMPGFLGSDERTFLDRYAKPIMAVSVNIRQGPVSTSVSGGSGSNVASVKDFEEAERKLEQLHKQVLPFILRRLKEDVLKELPEKTILDLYCDPLPSMEKLVIEDPVEEPTNDDNDKEGSKDMGKLHSLQLACVHPGLASNPSPSQQDLTTWADESPKLTLLRDLMSDCGLELEDFDIDNGHRLLIFAQHKAVLDLTASFLQKNFAHLQYLRLDGSVPSGERSKMAHTFNQDRCYTVMLLTTTVGGLGLNLIGADVVVFLEHDWNPQRDLQAMDRAHRLGQRRSVTVYRLLVKRTMEERMMNLQRWKLKVAKTVVNAQNASVTTLSASGNLLDLLEDVSNNATVQKSKTEVEAENYEDKRALKLLKKFGE